MLIRTQNKKPQMKFLQENHSTQTPQMEDGMSFTGSKWQIDVKANDKIKPTQDEE